MGCHPLVGKRRIVFNFLVGLTGVVATAVFLLIGNSIVRSGEDFIEPLALIGIVLLYGFMANVCYTLGWITELRERRTIRSRVRTFEYGPFAQVWSFP